jgi:hypothetical protein
VLLGIAGVVGSALRRRQAGRTVAP